MRIFVVFLFFSWLCEMLTWKHWKMKSWVVVKMCSLENKPSFKNKVNSIAVHKHASPLQELAYHMGSLSVTCHPAEVTFLPLHQPIKAGTRFNNPTGMQGWVGLEECACVVQRTDDVLARDCTTSVLRSCPTCQRSHSAAEDDRPSRGRHGTRPLAHRRNSRDSRRQVLEIPAVDETGDRQWQHAVCNSVFAFITHTHTYSALTLLIGWQEGHPACK